MSRNPSTSLWFWVFYSPACPFPCVKSLSDDGYYISVPRIRAHNFVKCARLFLIAGALTFHPIYCSSAVEGLQGYTENVTVVSTRLFTSRVNTCWVFFRMALKPICEAECGNCYNKRDRERQRKSETASLHKTRLYWVLFSWLEKL